MLITKHTHNRQSVALLSCQAILRMTEIGRPLQTAGYQRRALATFSHWRERPPPAWPPALPTTPQCRQQWGWSPPATALCPGERSKSSGLRIALCCSPTGSAAVRGPGTHPPEWLWRRRRCRRLAAVGATGSGRCWLLLRCKSGGSDSPSSWGCWELKKSGCWISEHKWMQPHRRW